VTGTPGAWLDAARRRTATGLVGTPLRFPYPFPHACQLPIQPHTQVQDVAYCATACAQPARPFPPTRVNGVLPTFAQVHLATLPTFPGLPAGWWTLGAWAHGGSWGGRGDRHRLAHYPCRRLHPCRAGGPPPPPVLNTTTLRIPLLRHCHAIHVVCAVATCLRHLREGQKGWRAALTGLMRKDVGVGVALLSLASYGGAGVAIRRRYAALNERRRFWRMLAGGVTQRITISSARRGASHVSDVCQRCVCCFCRLSYPSDANPAAPYSR